ncbi:MAG: sigma-54-dependent Fis family transcriptional regulator [Thiotrichaceae bacterium]|nr:sigma-54-dependent Fis family transcriptional regulator [Thiotrichaceae bacterium]PCI14770.1 MAG: sigma-54-dependent Fis family transcriptional regulator [Thiotrichales bacterium]
MTKPTALVVDDEPDICELLELTLLRMGIDCHTADSLTAAKAVLLQHPDIDLCLTDMKLPDGNGIDLVQFIQERHPEIPTAVITAHGNMESAVLALKAGAFDFVSKPVDLGMLRSLVTTALKLSPKHQDNTPEAALTLLGNSAEIDNTRATIKKLARSQAPVHISGESGTGKELAARLIHEQGPRADKHFIPVNCGAIPEALVESEFFGHIKGSFTGATTNKDGLFQAADGGTLFLDEVADLPLHMQVKLLRAIQEKAIRPVGAHQESKVDVRILSATHKDLAQLVKEGKFRQDLFYRINVIELPMPALRARTEDIPPLIDHILRKLASDNGTSTPTIDETAVSSLQQYHFPGNVRELENILERAMTLCEQETIRVEDLQLIHSSPLEQPAPSSTTPQAIASQSLDPLLGNIEKETIEKALEQSKYNKTAAAKQLGISFGALRYRMKKLGL